MAIREKISLILETKQFEQGLTRARRKFGVFAERARNALGGGRTGSGARGRQRGGLVESLSRGGGVLSAVAGGFGATAAVSAITRSIQGAFDNIAQQSRNVALRGAGPAGSRQNELAQMQAAAVQTRKVIFGVGDAMNGLIAASLGTREEFTNWKESILEAVNATTDYADGLKLLKNQERITVARERARGEKLVRRGEALGLVTEGAGQDEEALIGQLFDPRATAAGLRRLNRQLEANLKAGVRLTSAPGAIQAQTANFFGYVN